MVASQSSKNNMPKVKLPTTPKGWVATLAASMIGFVSGTAFLAWLEKRVK